MSRDKTSGPTATAPRDHAKATRRLPSGPKSCDFSYPPEQGNKQSDTENRRQKPPIGLAQSGGFINDASCLNRTPILGVADVHTVDDVRQVLQIARENHLKVTAAGQRHSMGGQSFVRDGMVLDMRRCNQIRIDKQQMIANVQSGATWAQLQRELDREGLSVRAMQSINVFSIGGSLSVNAHGIAHKPGPLASTVKSLRIMLSNGEIRTASPRGNTELFRLALGGYGLFGVILDAGLDITNNEAYQLQTRYMDYHEFPAYYEKNVAEDENIELMYGRVSISPTSYLRETALHTYRKPALGVRPPLLEPVNTTAYRGTKRGFRKMHVWSQETKKCTIPWGFCETGCMTRIFFRSTSFPTIGCQRL